MQSRDPGTTERCQVLCMMCLPVHPSRQEPYLAAIYVIAVFHGVCSWSDFSLLMSARFNKLPNFIGQIIALDTNLKHFAKSLWQIMNVLLHLGGDGEKVNEWDTREERKMCQWQAQTGVTGIKGLNHRE